MNNNDATNPMNTDEKVDKARAFEAYINCDHEPISPNYSGLMSVCEVCRGRYSEESFNAGFNAGLATRPVLANTDGKSPTWDEIVTILNPLDWLQRFDKEGWDGVPVNSLQGRDLMAMYAAEMLKTQRQPLAAVSRPDGKECRYCAEKYDRIPSSVSDAWVHPDTPIGRVVCASVESPAESALRELASELGNGGYNAPRVDVEVFKAKIRDGIDTLIRVEKERAPRPDGWVRITDESSLPKESGWYLWKSGPNGDYPFVTRHYDPNGWDSGAERFFTGSFTHYRKITPPAEYVAEEGSRDE